MARHKKTLELIAHMQTALEKYSPRTVRGLFYDLVRKNAVPNDHGQGYRRVQRALKAAREDGLINWSDIIDPGRDPRILTTYPSLGDYAALVPQWYRQDPWVHTGAIVWVEKTAQLAPVWDVCRRYRLPLFHGSGYDSWTSLDQLSEMIRDKSVEQVLILGDHDPSGLDIPRALGDFIRSKGFTLPRLKRIALTLDQIEERNLPHQRVKDDAYNRELSGGRKKKGDPRAEEYKKLYGEKCWELDALSPAEIQEILELEITSSMDMDHFNRVLLEEEADRSFLWDALGRFLS